MIEITNRCNHCAQCIRCGRNRPYKAVYCDVCGAEINDTVYLHNGHEKCADCVLGSIPCYDAGDLDVE